MGVTFDKRTIVVTALTSAAAVCMNGKTTAKAFAFNREVQIELDESRNTYLVFVDEVSFASVQGIDCESLNQKLKEILDNPMEPFGVVHIVFSGDLTQLSPVGDVLLYKYDRSFSNGGLQDAQLWNDLLDSSGGALEVRKCMFHLAHYQFTPRGAPVLQSFAPDQLTVQVQESGPHGTKVPIKYLQPTTSRKTLGCYKCPAGGHKQSLQAITEKAIAKATLVAKSALDPKCTMRHYTSVFLPSVTYPLPTCSIPEKQLRKLHNKTAGLFLNRLGYSCKTPRAVVFGPPSLGGANFRPLYDEQGSRQVELILKHLRTPLGIHDHLRTALAWIQRLSGTSYSILENPDDPLPHLETVFFPSVRAYLTATNSRFQLHEKHCTPLQQVNDTHIMDNCTFKPHLYPRPNPTNQLLQALPPGPYDSRPGNSRDSHGPSFHPWRHNGHIQHKRRT
ncbi:hypothetical protein IV203_013580 [Nitzschia inconspicua]|uniref:DNA helicase n=1 Tax=Nitzschia inconspicua TaxID=303405 RepID=A0A9K3Q8W9_9STRA|nr:hypothetical protein IV203_013580 [Nitzschia inconspicua]